MRRSVLLPVGLAFVLLFAQSAALLHGFVHLTETRSSSRLSDQQLPHPAACELCLAAAALDSGVPATVLVFAAVVTQPLVVVHSPASFQPRPVPVYSSRAPPRFV